MVARASAGGFEGFHRPHTRPDRPAPHRSTG